RKLELAYVDKAGRSSTRVVWPIALGFFDHARMLAAWCETRQAFRHFRLDRMAAVEVLDERLPKRRRALLIDWRRAEGLDE
ncbi:MAG: WYL domain-containing protein, partial [Roseiarcus sp.]